MQCPQICENSEPRPLGLYNCKHHICTASPGIACPEVDAANAQELSCSDPCHCVSLQNLPNIRNCVQLFASDSAFRSGRGQSVFEAHMDSAHHDAGMCTILVAALQHTLPHNTGSLWPRMAAPHRTPVRSCLKWCISRYVGNVHKNIHALHAFIA